ncbi:uncharacterized protein DUF2750 [Chitinophaga dinghuensis]|uniref:Uncharacterized protein DUF2750 n=1 Tax=Chitinophaga dinghuensis TaxID=1539050 RepID=A0A327W0Y0_9BACT|nr:DUF2750 domain-containing protein [Chitinophaga dinghuensis]RAJ81896.1 uncharacterized protein DUF2750 [Chitinophaga dinghuensis]
MKKISQQELEKVMALPPFDRYKYTVKWIADGEVIFILENNAALAMGQLDEHKVIPIWSAAEYAALSKSGDWSDFEVKSISLEAFENTYIPIIAENNYLLDVFPLGDKSGFVVTLGEFLRDLDDELSNY